MRSNCLFYLLVSCFQLTVSGQVPEYSAAGFFSVPESGREVLDFNISWRFFKDGASQAERNDFEIAIRDIKAGEQLTDDYGYLNISYPFRGIDEGTRRKVVYPNDLIKYYKVWENKIKKVFPKILTVEQPLKGVIEPSIWGMIEKITQGDQLLESILSNYYNDENYLP